MTEAERIARGITIHVLYRAACGLGPRAIAAGRELEARGLYSLAGMARDCREFTIAARFRIGVKMPAQSLIFTSVA